MADSTKDVTLQIRARDFSQKTLQDVGKALIGLVEAQAEQVEAFKKGDVTAKQLEASYKKLEQAAQALVKQNAVINTFNAQAAAFDAAKVKAESLRATQTELAKALAATENPTKAQVKSLNDISKSANAAEAAQLRLLDRLNKTGARLKEYGIDTANVGAAQQQIVAAVGSANVVLEHQDALIETLDDTLKQHKEQLAAVAKEEADYAAAVKLSTESQAQAAAETAAFATKTDAATQLARRIQYEHELKQLLDERAASEAKALAEEQAVAQFTAAISAQKERERAADLQLLEDQQRERAGLQALASQLEITTAQYAAQARAKEAAKQSNVQQNLTDIANPQGAQLRTLDGVSSSVETLQAKVAAVRGPVKDLTQALQALTAAQKGAAAIGGQIDAYRQQLTTLREARTAYVDARTAVNNLVASLNQGVANGNVVNQIASAEAKLRAAASAMSEQTTRARELRVNLQAAGVSTGDLEGAEARLVSTVKLATTTTQQYTAAVERYGKAKADGSTAIDKFNSGERTTLGFMQRLRGEVLGLAAAYTGVQGALSLVKDTLDTVTKQGQIESRLGLVFNGDQSKVKDELTSIRKLADDAGVSFLHAADGFSRIATAGKYSSLSLDQQRFIFQGITKYATQAGLTTEQYSRSLVALEQIIGVGTIGAQDFVHQLGQDMPGAVEAMAKGLGITEAEMRKTMATTKLSSDALINMVRQLGVLVQSGGDSGALALSKASARLETAKNDFEIALAKGGFEDVYIQFIQKLTKILEGDEGQRLAKQLSVAFSAVVDVLQFLLDHLTTLEVLLGVFAAGKVIGGITTFINAIKLADVALTGFLAKQAAFAAIEAEAVAGGGVLAASSAGFTGLATSIGTAAVAAGGFLGIVTKLAGALAVLAVSYEGAKYIFDKTGVTDYLSGDVSKGDARFDMKGGYVPGTQTGLGNTRGQIGDGKSSNDPGGGISMVDLQYAAISKEMEKQQKELDTQSREARHRSAKEELDDRIQIATEVLRQQRDQITEQLGNSAQGATAMARINAQIAEATATETTKFNNEQKTKNEAAAKQLEDLLRETGEEITNIRAANEQKLTSLDPSADFEQRLKARMDTINKQFKQLDDQVAKIRRLNPGKADAVAAQVTALRGPAGQVAVEQTQNDELVRTQTTLNELTAARTSELQEQQALFESGGQSQQQLVTNTIAINNKFQQSIQKAIDDVRTFALTVKSVQNDPGKKAGLDAKLGTAQANNNSDKQNAQLQLTTAEANVNALLAQRQAMLDDIQAKKQLSLITDGQAADQMNAVNAKFHDNILEAGAAINSYIDALEKFTNDPTVIANLEQQRQKMQQIQDQTTKNQKVWSDYQTQIQTGSADVITNSLTDLVTQFGKVAQGQESAGDAAKSWATKTALAFLQMIEQAAAYIIKLQIIKSLQGFGSGGAASAGSAAAGADAGATSAEGLAVTSDLAHTGGVIQHGMAMRRNVSASIFLNAQRFHSGGLPGLRSDEVATILKKKEEVLTPDDPRNVLNGGKNGVAGGAAPHINQRIILVDDQRNVHDAMSSAQGEQVTIQTIKRNAPTIRQSLGLKA